MAKFLRVALMFVAVIVLFSHALVAQGVFENFVTMGLQGGMQEHSDMWIGYFQLFGDFGPEYAAQLRLAVRSGLFNSIVPTTLFTTVILNIGSASQRFYLGVGIGVPMNSIGTGGTSLQAKAMLGLRAPATPGVIAAIEGGLVAPFEFNELPKMYFSLAVSFPL